MTDRELLELAAKAIGEEIVAEVDGLMMLRGVQDGWNPLTDDGDALRLAVKLNLNVFALYHAGTDRRPGTGVLRHGNPMPPEFWLWHGDDPYAATRRAIVRAAAEIGRAMP